MNTVLCKVTFTAKRQIPGWLGKPGFCSWLGAGSVRGRGPHGPSGDSLSREVRTCSPSPPVGGPTLMFYQLGACEHGCQALSGPSPRGWLHGPLTDPAKPCEHVLGADTAALWGPGPRLGSKRLWRLATDFRRRNGAPACLLQVPAQSGLSLL